MAFSNFVPMMFKTQSPNPSHTSSGWNCFPQHHSNRLVNGSVPPLIHFIHLISSVSHRGFPHSLRRRHCYTPSPIDVMPLCSYFKTTVRYDSNKTLYTVQIKVGPSHYSMVIWPGFPHAPFCERKQRNICWNSMCMGVRGCACARLWRWRDMQHGVGHTCCELSTLSRYHKQKKILITEQLPWPHPQSVIIVFYSSL